MEKYSLNLVMLALAFTCGRIEASYRDTTTDMCLEPVLADTTRTMCEQMDGFSKCQTDSHVPDGDSAKLYEILNKMSESLLLLSAEECDLNAQFNMECTNEFVTCLDMVYTFSSNKISCSDADYNRFLACTQLRIPNSYGPCYFSSWVQEMVNKTRDIECVAAPVTLFPVSYDDTRVTGPADNANQQSSGDNTNNANNQPGAVNNNANQQSSGDNTNQQSGGDINQQTGFSLRHLSDSIVFTSSSCDAGGIRFHVSADCAYYQQEWIAQGIVYQPQGVAPGTLFDVSICGLNHRNLVTCGGSSVSK